MGLVDLYKVIFAEIFIVLLLWTPSQAVSLVGQDIYFPLVPTDPSHFSQYFNMNSAIIRTCNRRYSIKEIMDYGKHQKCIRDYEMKQNIFENSDPLKDCSLNMEFLHCIKTVMKEMKSLCLWNDLEFIVYNYPIRAFEASLHYVCSDNATVYTEYITGKGPECVTKSRQELRECSRLHQPTGLFIYNDHNCWAGWDFQNCIFDAIYDTCSFINFGFADMCTAIIVEGLKVTPCWNHAPIYMNKNDTSMTADLPEQIGNAPLPIPEPAAKPEPEGEIETEDGENKETPPEPRPFSKGPEEPHEEEEVDVEEEDTTESESEATPGGTAHRASSSVLQVALVIFFLYVSVAP